MTSFLPIIAALVVGMLLAPLQAAAAAPAASPTGSASPVPSLSATPSASAQVPIARLGYEVVSRRPHDTTAWTEGLLMDPDGRLFESTGINGVSQVRELDPLTGAVLRSVPVPADAYGEGLALVGDRLLVQLTWQEGRAITYDKETFAVLGTFGYEGEGWGLCFDGKRLVMSNGSDTLTFRDPATFGVLGQVAVTAGGEPVPRLNELECVDGEVWANVWETDWIVRIDPATGAVTGALDTTGLLEPHPARTDPGAVLNGIARVPGGDTWLLTGKRWPEAIEVRITEP
jgi:glutamine cyclotransferase